MKKIVAAMSAWLLAVMLGACATSPAGQAAEEHAGHQHDAAQAADAQQQDVSMAHMHANMQRMQEMMAKIHATKDPAERQRLMAEHRAAMRSQMQAMHGMMNQGSCPMMGAMSGGQGMGQGGMMGGKKGGMMGNSADHQCAMMGHMQMMHGMMQQMMEHMSAEHGDKPDDKSAAPDQKQQEHVH
jgi:hypothetical protein